MLDSHLTAPRFIAAQPWFAGLPPALQERLREINTLRLIGDASYVPVPIAAAPSHSAVPLDLSTVRMVWFLNSLGIQAVQGCDHHHITCCFHRLRLHFFLFFLSGSLQLALTFQPLFFCLTVRTYAYRNIPV